MSEHTEIVRTIQVEEKTIIIHIHLTEAEIRRLLLPHIASAFADEWRRQTSRQFIISGSISNYAWISAR